MSSILSINALQKSYGYIQALKGVSFDVPRGCVFGILGPNGSGKTTLLGIVLDVLKSSGGSYQWMENLPADKARQKIGSLLETPNFYHYLSAVDNLTITTAISHRGNADYEKVLRRVNLWERKDSKFQTYSLGMKQRLAIAAALLGSPEVLVLDEPTNGLDAEGITEIRHLIRDLNSQGTTVIMASHLLDEVEKVCTHVAILKKGTLLLTGNVNEVFRNEDIIEIKAADMPQLERLLATMPGITSVKRREEFLHIVAGTAITTAKVNEFCMRNSIIPDHLVLKKKSLETKFMELTSAI